MAQPPAAVRSAQEGVELAKLYPPHPGGGARTLQRRGTSPLTVEQRERVVDTFVVLLEGLYAHLPLKRAMYASDPVQRLRLLRQRADEMDEAEFHAQLRAVLAGLRDAHTRYIGPTSLDGRAARLPFLVEAYGAPPEQRYIVSKVVEHLVDDPHFQQGVEVRWWNGVPIDRAVELHGRSGTGGRPDSQRARGLETLTLRALRYNPPPDEYWIDVGYLDDEGTERETRLRWAVVKPRKARTAGQAPDAGGLAYAIDRAAEMRRRAKKLLFAAERWNAEGKAAPSGRRATSAGGWLDTELEDHVGARVVETPSGRFGLLRLWNFNVVDDDAFVDEVVRLLGLLPPTGVIVDLRANPGGLIAAAERLLQLFTPGRIAPARFSLMATPLTRALAAARLEFEPWRASLRDAVATGELYSLAAPLTSARRCNDVGQVYSGPAVAVVDALTYSAGDLFAAGFVDNEIGPLLSVGEATGAGGANVWEQEEVVAALLGTGFALEPLPAELGYTVSVRRATRIGSNDGAAIEDVGVRGRPYAMTAQDLIDNQDLHARCGELLSHEPRTFLALEPLADGRLEVTAEGLDRLDYYVDGRPHGPLAPAGGSLGLTPPEGWHAVAVEGFASGQLRQRRQVNRP